MSVSVDQQQTKPQNVAGPVVEPPTSSPAAKGASYDQGVAANAPANQPGFDQQAAALTPADPAKKPEKVTGDSGKYGIAGSNDPTWKPAENGVGGSMNNTQGVGIGRGTGEDDNIQVKTDEKGNPVYPPKKDAQGKPILDAQGKEIPDTSAGPIKERKNATVELSNNVKQWDSADIKKDNSLGEGKTGTYTETFAGSSSSEDKTLKAGIKEGKLDTSLYEKKGAIGAGAKIGAKAGVGDKEGSNANIDIHSGANAGASGSVKVDHTGVKAEGAASATVDLVNVSGNADATKAWKVDGVSDPVKANVGVSGSARVFAEAGIGAKAGIGTDFTGIEAEAGAFAGAEAKADLHGQLGPAKGKLEASALAGAGIGAKGGITYKNGKIQISGQLWAAYGYGAKVGGSVEIDLKQAVELGIVAAKAAYEWADEDKDGKLSLNDGATKVSKTANEKAEQFDKGVDGFIGATDVDKDGKFTVTDAKALGNKALEKGGELVDKGIESGKQLGKDALKKGGELVEAGKEKAGELVDGAKATGKAALEKGKEVIAAIDTPEERAALLDKGKEKVVTTVNNAVDTAKQKGAEAVQWGTETLVAADKKIDELKNAAKDKAVDTYEAVRDFDYKGTAVAAKDKIVETGTAAVQKAGQLVDKGAETVKAGAQKVADTAVKAKDTVVETYKALDTEAERAAALEKAKQYAAWKAQQAKEAAKKAAALAEQKAAEAKAWAEQQAIAAEAKARELAAKAKEAIANAPQAVANKVAETYNAAADGVSKAYNTASEGLSKAGSTIASGASKLNSYLNPWAD